MQIFALAVVMHAEWLTKQDDNPSIQRVRKQFAQGYFDNQGEAYGEGSEDLSAVQWESPSSNEEVMDEIAMFNQAMAQSHMAVAADDGGEWL